MFNSNKMLNSNKISSVFNMGFTIFVLLLSFIPAQLIAANNLTISQLEAKVVGNDVFISWNTNNHASACVEYGFSQDYEFKICALTNPRIRHTIKLENLIPETIYHYRIISEDENDNKINSFDASIKTGKRVDTKRPIIDNLNLAYVGGSVAFITWETSEPATSVIEYGIGDSFDKKKESRKKETLHEMIIHSLNPSALYFYRISSTDADGNRVVSSNQSFRTFRSTSIDSEALRIFNITPVSSKDSAIGETHAIIEWTTSRPAKSTLSYGTNSGKLNKRIKENKHTVNHSIEVTELTAGTIYYFSINAKDILSKQIKAPGNEGSFSFTTRTPKPDIHQTLDITETITTQIDAAKGSREINTNDAFSPQTESQELSLIQKILNFLSKKEVEKPQQILGMSTTRYTPATKLLKSFHQSRIYAIVNNQRYWIRSFELMRLYGYGFESVKRVSNAELEHYLPARLVTTPDITDVYFLYPNENTKIIIPSEFVFKSYPNNKQSKIITIAALDLEQYEPARFIKTPESDTIYLLENNTRHLLLTDEAFERLEFSANKVIEINRTHLSGFALGDSIE